MSIFMQFNIPLLWTF